MLKYLFIAFTFAFISIATKAQDTIIKIDQSIIVAKVLEINQEQIKYKKYSYLEGPTYVIEKNQISKIVFHNGYSEIFKTTKPIVKPNTYNSKAQRYSTAQKEFEKKEIKYADRKGVHISTFFAPGKGNVFKDLDNSNISTTTYTGRISQVSKFSNTMGFELHVYTNNFFGVKTGLIFQNYKYETEESRYYLNSTNYNTSYYNIYKIHNFGFPLQLSFSTGRTIALTCDFGLMIGIPYKATLSSEVSNLNNETYTKVENFTKEISSVIIHESAQAGILIEFTPKINFSLGFYQSYSLMSYIESDKIHSKMYGAYFSLSFKFD